MTDLTYIKGSMFTTFVPRTKAGEDAWKEIAAQTGGTGMVFNSQAKSTISQLRTAGYTVGVQKKISKSEIDAVYAELDDLFKS